jgi:hypothetical protein
MAAATREEPSSSSWLALGSLCSMHSRWDRRLAGGTYVMSSNKRSGAPSTWYHWRRCSSNLPTVVLLYLPQLHAMLLIIITTNNCWYLSINQAGRLYCGRRGMRAPSESDDAYYSFVSFVGLVVYHLI